MKDPQLEQKAHILLSSDLFVHTVDNAALVEKQTIFLVLAGFKPVGFVSSGHWKDTEGGRESEADDPTLVSTFLTSLGLHFRLFTDQYTTDAIISLHDENLVQFETNIQDDHLAGHLYGYPETAIEAYLSPNKSLALSEEEQEKVLKAAQVPEHFLNFRMSTKNYAQEVLTIQKWYAFCKLYGLA